MENAKARCEADLAERAQQGDTEASGELLMKYYPLMHSIAIKYAAKTSRFESDDLANQCFAVLMHRGMKAFDRTKASFCTWIHFHVRSIIAHTIKETNSKGKALISSAKVFSEISDTDSRDVSSRIPAKEVDVCLTASIEQMCMRLEDRRANVLRMRAKGSTLQEVADYIGISKERARQLELDAIQELQEVYAGCESPEDMPDIVEIKNRRLSVQEGHAGNGAATMTIAKMIETITTDEGLRRLDQEIESTEGHLARLKSLRKAFSKSDPKVASVRKVVSKLDETKEQAIVYDIKKHGSSMPGEIAERTGLTPIGVGKTVAVSSRLSKDGYGKVVLVD